METPLLGLGVFCAPLACIQGELDHRARSPRPLFPFGDVAVRPLQDLAIGEVLDWYPFHPRTFSMTPFLPDGFTASGIYVNPGNTEGNCRNCRGTGANFEYVTPTLLKGLDEGFFTLEELVEVLQPLGPCVYCGGSGKVRVLAPYPMTGRVLIPHHTCTEVWCGDVIVFTAGAYEEVRTIDGREFAFMHEGAVLLNLGPCDEPVITPYADAPKILVA